MKKLSLALLTAAVTSAAALPVSAQEYMFTYSKLFTHMKQNVKEGHEDVKVGFFFLNADTKQNCVIEKAWMEKEEHYEELKSSPYHELIVPLDNNLKSANPLVFVQTPMDQRCDFSMVVMTKEPFNGEIAYADVEKLMPQMQAMLEDLGGMFASWFTPDVEGVTLEFANKLNSKVEFSNGSSKDIVDGKVQVALSDIGEGGTMTLPQETARVLPYLPKAN
ncbi:hypothetical protein TW78_15825 [Vibrio coralliilyticus]|uniref:Uncharacterized protein n=1 Tax=Vibrio coralliilyticus TaxID=190893 RepID=A0A1V0I7T1_9VIBR|nr:MULTISPECIES: DUF2987 domain-containing protein [Vibrio]ARC92252.1 hypothetical protein B6A42_09245 [Vibrio coralliilyticus]AXN30495.1 DUF2987 domain-containing protein [Vibrio coralliilyticus]KFI12274.1 hypothetical protein IX95_10055 [Vibrio sp. B183]KJY70930.1 hypothetical protein TW78_15825 [Vibrio coralliilyticus]KPH26882.1 hypothetical protein ADU60_01080 [Vibrio coralliilyticus]